MINILKLRKLEKERKTRESGGSGADNSEETLLNNSAATEPELISQEQVPEQTNSTPENTSSTFTEKKKRKSSQKGKSVKKNKDTDIKTEMVIETANVVEPVISPSEEIDEVAINVESVVSITEQPAELIQEEVVSEEVVMSIEQETVPEPVIEEPSQVVIEELIVPEDISEKLLKEFLEAEKIELPAVDQPTVTKGQIEETAIKQQLTEVEVKMPEQVKKRQPEFTEKKQSELTDIKSNADSNKKGSESIIHLVGFNLAKEYYGVDIMKIREIIRMVEITKVPRAPEYVEGVINLRGTVVPVINLRTKIKMPRKEWDKDSRIIVIELKEAVIGFIVDSVREVLRIPESVLAPPPVFTVGKGSDYITAVAKLEDRLIILMEPEKLLTEQENKAISAI